MVASAGLQIIEAQALQQELVGIELVDLARDFSGHARQLCHWLRFGRLRQGRQRLARRATVRIGRQGLLQVQKAETR